jgi:hypothetical protein
LGVTGESIGFDLRSQTAAAGLDIGLMKRQQLSAMHKNLLVLLSCVWLGFGNEGPPACQALTHFGVQGWQLSAGHVSGGVPQTTGLYDESHDHDKDALSADVCRRPGSREEG